MKPIAPDNGRGKGYGGFLWNNEDTYLENVILLLINALPVAGLFCDIITAIEPEEEDL